MHNLKKRGKIFTVQAKVVGKRSSPSAFQSFELFLHSINPSKNFHALVRAPSPHYSIYLLLAYTPILFTTIY